MRVAAACDRYIGVDASGEVLGRLADHLRHAPRLRHVELRQAPAHQLSFVEDHSVDLVILNSVVQYFPDLDYLLDVLETAVRVTAPGGHIFVGDVRSLPLLRAFHTSVQLHRASDDTPVRTLQRDIDHAVGHEKELVLDPQLFGELARRWDTLGRADISLKAGAYDNELSRFRYDVVLHVGPRTLLAAPQRWLAWDAEGTWPAQVAAALTAEPDSAVGVCGLPDARVVKATEAARILRRDEHDGMSAGTLRAACQSAHAEDPDAVMALARQLHVGLAWSGFASTGIYDAIFNPRWSAAEQLTDAPRSALTRHANAPLRTTGDREFGTLLQEYSTGHAAGGTWCPRV